MQACDIMTKGVLTVPPDKPVQEVAQLMAQKRISGLPVVTADGRVVGVVSESDLLRRVELGTGQSPPRWPELFEKPSDLARMFTKAHGAKVSDVMARPVVSVEHDSTIDAVADTLDRHHIKRVPVMQDGRLAGIIARSDLVRALSQTKAPSAGQVHLGNGIVMKSISDAMRDLPWLDTSYLNISVSDGVVRLKGYVQSRDHANAVRVLIEEVPGVERVEQDLEIGLPTVLWDGTQVRS